MSEPVKAEEVVATPIKRRRGRPRKIEPVPPLFAQPQQPQWPCQVELTTKAGQFSFGCLKMTVQAGFFVFETPSGAYTQRRYVAASEVLSLITHEVAWAQQIQPPQLQVSPSFVPPDMAVGKQPSGPQEFSARSGLRSTVVAGGIPVSEVHDPETGQTVTATAGFLS